MIHSLFTTSVFQAPLTSRARVSRINSQLILEIQDLSQKDKVGKAWSRENYPRGYTSYASMSRLFEFSSSFDDLKALIDLKVRDYIKALGYQNHASDLEMTNLWANVMKKGCSHTAHIHPHSVLSGTYYVQVPSGASPLKIEDPRLGLFMNTPLLKDSVRENQKRFFKVQPRAGEVVLFESWLRHEVPEVTSSQPRISLSFNYQLKSGVRGG